MTHTPGPWKINNFRFIMGNDRYIATLEEPNLDSNARLIAAAPELLEALEEIAEGRGRYNQDPLQHASNCIEDMVSIAKEAIKKARG